MRVSNSLTEWKQRREALAGTIGFVPTMGALHRGHASLVERCLSENDTAVVSIFVNPTQFNDATDFARYPRSMNADLDLLECLGVHEVLAPEVAELYPSGLRFRVEEPVEENALSSLMEGRHRPGFFTGVLTVVLKLLNLVRAERAYFGEKDYQQLQLITQMARDLFIPTQIFGCPTVRESSGLAESSRNALLSPAARGKAACLSRALAEARSAEEANQWLEAEGFAVDYVEEHWGRRFGAVHLEGVRLIDNVPL
ncbi:MAG TPA: pantoate--beta-alanine ligase [Bryobacteraceae bacterium]